MCIATIAWQWNTDRPLVIAANRDEFYHRPAAPLHFWPGDEVLAGRDLAVETASTWMGINRRGRFALITNVRAPSEARPDAPSRGPLVAAFLEGDMSPSRYIFDVASRRSRYNGFNLIVGSVAFDAQECWFLHSRDFGPRRLTPGIYGLSNATLDTPWPKVQRAVGRFTMDLLMRPGHDTMLDSLRDPVMAHDESLPETGVPLDWERRLSSVFIASETYGTRASTVLEVVRQDVTVTERRYPPDVSHGAPHEQTTHEFTVRRSAHKAQPASSSSEP
jgi:uncharacterized protein with NRDE domain